MVKKLSVLALIGVGIALMGLVCQPEPIEISDGVTMHGKILGKDNAVSDTCLDEVLRLMGEGATAYDAGGLAYIWIYHKYYDDSAITTWTQLTNCIDKSGGGDTSSSFCMTASHTVGGGVFEATWDSILRERWTYGGYFTDSCTVWYFSQTDTVVLYTDETETFDWTVTADSNTAGIQSALLYHVIYGLQTGTCEEIDSMVIMFARDTTTVPVNYSYDFTNDSIIFTGIGTIRDTVDTLKRVKLLDESGTVMTSYSMNTKVDSNTTPSIRYAIGVTTP